VITMAIPAVVTVVPRRWDDSEHGPLTNLAHRQEQENQARRLRLEARREQDRSNLRPSR
jgi:hypothetical protein